MLMSQIWNGGMDMGKVIAVSNQKGGVGKTTSLLNISVVLAQKGFKVLMIDSDPQASLTLSLSFNPLDFEKSLVDVYEKDTEIINSIYDTEIEGLSLIPSTPLLASIDLKLINQMSRERKLAKALNHIKGLFDFILIDNGPNLSLLSINSLSSADFVLVVCETSQLSYFALDPLMDTIAGIKEELNENLEILGVIATLYDSRTLIDKYVLESLQSNYEVLGVIKRTVAAKRGLQKGLPVVLTEPNSDIAVEYKKIADLIIEKVGE